ncbi:flagellar assembly protein A [Clostridium sp.]|uniref:flagellar assembly protein A n=1 Tax=Clostridium sp. TaxID=1506 RepID=UPI001A626146|nr:flagellar assembly protein A [Clostridium sp.]MBK5240368.1 DUF342 domain-containing protein [Clostridium sp.]
MAGKVGTKNFQGVNVSECLQSASISLGVPVEKLKYSILEEKNGFFKKHAVISIEDVDYLEKIEIPSEETNGTIEVVLGEIIIKNPKQGGKPALISATNSLTIILDGEKVNLYAPVYAESNLEVLLKEDEAKRQMDLRTSLDKMEAYISIMYEPNITYKLKDLKAASSVVLETEVKEETMPPKFTAVEIENELINHNIKYGILKAEIIKCCEVEIISELLIAKGKKPIMKIDDRFEIKYDLAHKELSENHDTKQIVDYKAIGTVNAVEKGQVLAILYPGAVGEDGMDIMGKIVKTNNAKKIVLAAGSGAEMKDECTVVAKIEGRPSVKGKTFFVYKTYEVNGDVELKTGNVKFLGDIIIHGSVHEGMSVEAGNSILIKDNVAEAIIIANGDIVIRGNIFHSAISAGKEDVITQEYLSDLMSMKNDLEKIIASISQLKEMNLLEKNTSDGELIKILLETKFKKLPKTSIKVLEKISQSEGEEDPLVFIIKHKILNLGPLSIEHYEELNDAVSIIDNKIVTLSIDLTLPVDVVLDYCQDSIIKSSGNVIFSGKGQYVSQIHASDSVIFKKDKSVARGGLIKAGKEIKCKTVGGNGGVSTQLIVENHGQIWAEIAYSNTRFVIGAREYVLDITSKNVHAYIDDSGELIVDKLRL